jgi:hypothetical protein
MKLKDFKLLAERWSRHIHEQDDERTTSVGCDFGEDGVPNDKCRHGDYLSLDGAGVTDDNREQRVIGDPEGVLSTMPWAADKSAKVEKVQQGYDIGHGFGMITATERVRVMDAASPEELATATAAFDADTGPAPDAAASDTGPEIAGAAPTENLARQIVQTLQAHLVTYAGAPEVQPGAAGAPIGGGENFIDGKFGPLTRKWLRHAMKQSAIPKADDMVYIPSADEGSEDEE